MKAMGLEKMASSFMGSIPVSRNAKKKGKKKVGLEDDEEYKPHGDDEEFSSSSGPDGDDDDNEFRMSRTKLAVESDGRIMRRKEQEMKIVTDDCLSLIILLVLL
ncbi:hypothetical protein L2E82_18061 [Cichorium intybus]|uniref:Uncharacterized protein n=1 Tax=Cichorium intybus TaxID=13427 RepID=A0ACB9F9Q6_CICIN|nr:hypothetical protein L2E82_18061 [Cichorium intybus]